MSDHYDMTVKTYNFLEYNHTVVCYITFYVVPNIKVQRHTPSAVHNAIKVYLKFYRRPSKENDKKFEDTQNR